MPKIIVLMGPPGVGKGTQAELISRRFGWPQISTGDMLRELAESGTGLGRQVKGILSSGQLVSDEILAKIIRERSQHEDCRGGYILDGFPRTLAQAHLLDRLAAEQHHELLFIKLAVSHEEVVQRLSGRRICSGCGAVYNVHHHPPQQEELCDRCRTPLKVRSDDMPEAIRRRLDVYEKKTAPMIEHYRARGNLVEVDGGQAVDKVFEEIIDEIEK